jgi:hypothetical protein
MWVRVSVRCEDSRVSAVLLGQLHRFADQIGMTTAGLSEMGWKIAEADLSVADEVVVPVVSEPRGRRLRAVGDGE